MNVTIEDLKKLDIQIGKIVAVEPIEGSEKLLKLQVDFGPPAGLGQGERKIKQILSGIAKFYTPEELVGKECPFIVNLEPRMMMGLESQGMLLAAGIDGEAVLLHPDKGVPEGAKIV